MFLNNKKKKKESKIFKLHIIKLCNILPYIKKILIQSLYSYACSTDYSLILSLKDNIIVF